MVVARGLTRARRQLQRATRLATVDQLQAAVPLAAQGCDTLRRAALSDPRRRDEYSNALVTVAELHLYRMALPAALATQDALVRLIESAHRPDRQPEADDRLSDALTRRGDTLRLCAQYDEARADLDRARQLARSPLYAAGSLNASGILAKDLGQHDAAAQHYRAALDLAIQARGAGHPELASLYHNLAGLEHARRRYTVGEQYARRAITLREQQYDPDSVEVAADLAVLGALLAGQQRLPEAERIFWNTLAIWRRHRGPGHYEVAVALQHLAAIHAATGSSNQAHRELRDALRIKRRTLGEHHPEVIWLTADAARNPTTPSHATTRAANEQLS